MHVLVAAIYILLSLIGCDGLGARSIVTHTTAQGMDVLYSEASINPLRARFSCIGSATGNCHYRLFAAHCDQAIPAISGAGCERRVLRELTVATGDSAELVGLPAGFSFCVRQEALAPAAPCKLQPQAGLAL